MPNHLNFGRMCLFLAAVCLFSASKSHGHDLGRTDEISARKSVILLTKSSMEDPTKISALMDLWREKCGQSKNERTCYLDECDVEKQSCRPDRKILFRGEAAMYPLPAVSSLVRSHWSGSEYAPFADARGLLKSLHRDIKLMGPISAFPQYKNDIILVRETLSTLGIWKYKAVDLEFHPQIELGKIPLTLRNTIFAFHQENALFYFKDRNMGEVPIDPLVSFTTSPVKAMTYLIGHGVGRLIVASVPILKIDSKCDDSDLMPGRIFDPKSCLIDEQFNDENELDAILYLNPDYIFKTFKIEY